MAKAGPVSQVGLRADREGTRRRLVRAAIDALREDGFSGASARAIARRAGCNQGLVFYHFGSVVNLLLAALDETSRSRVDGYRDAMSAASNPAQLVAVATDIYRRDLDAGHITVLAEMMAGCSSTPGLGVEVAARIQPWIDFTEETLRRVLGPSPLAQLVAPRDAAYAVVALYLGVEMLTHLVDDRSEAESLLAAAGRVADSVAMFGPRPGR